MKQITVHGKTYSLPKNTVWNEGPPPEIGWWPTFMVDWKKPNIRHLRYFNGVAWSVFMLPHATSYSAGCRAKLDPCVWTIKEIKWAAQWWK